MLLTNIAHAAENIADHLTHFYVFFMPDFARETYARRPWFEAVERRFKATRGTNLRETLPARAGLLQTMGLIAGKWPHSLAFRPGGVTRAIDLGEQMRLLALLAAFRDFLEKTLFAAPLEAVIALETGDALDSLRGRAGRRRRLRRLPARRARGQARPIGARPRTADVERGLSRTGRT